MMSLYIGLLLQGVPNYAMASLLLKCIRPWIMTWNPLHPIIMGTLSPKTHVCVIFPRGMRDAGHVARSVSKRTRDDKSTGI